VILYVGETSFYKNKVQPKGGEELT